MVAGILLTYKPSYSSGFERTKIVYADGDSIEIVLNSLLNSSQDRANVLLELGELAYARGLYKKALNMFSDAEGDTALFFRAMALSALGDKNKGKLLVSKISDIALKTYISTLFKRSKGEAHYYLHFGYFTQKEKALALAGKLCKNGIDAKLVTDGNGFAVVSGLYPSQKEAELEASTKARLYLWRLIKK